MTKLEISRDETYGNIRVVLEIWSALKFFFSRISFLLSFSLLKIYSIAISERNSYFRFTAKVYP